MIKNLKLFTIALSIFGLKSYAQVFTTNRTPVGMEHNMLLNATTQYQVTQTGSATLNLNALFDGRFAPSYTSVGPTLSSPTVILIENLPNSHIQAGAWVGWSTRYWQAKRFKIEGYDAYSGNNTWKILADFSNQDYTGGGSFVKKITLPGSYTKLRFTFYNAVGVNGRLGVSELFFIHPEAVTPYQGLLSSNSNLWSQNSNNLSYTNGNVGIGTTNTTDDWKLAVNGQIRAKEIKVETGWSDFVFKDDYRLPSLAEVEKHINDKGHLKDIPSEEEVKKNGIFLGHMDSKLLQKIEELTLYTIQQEKRINNLEQKNKTLKRSNNNLVDLNTKLIALQKRLDKLENK